MFFRNKNHNENFKRLEDQLHALTQAAAAESSRLNRLDQAVSQLLSQNQNTGQALEGNIGQLCQNISQLDSRLNENISQLLSNVQKHDMAIEDLLDEWDEKKSDESQIKAHFQESERTESLLLQLFEAYQEQFWNLKHFTAAKDESWTAQITLMEETLEQYRRSCQISMIQECGVEINYELHEVIDAADTHDPALDKTVADIYRCGYLYKGMVKKKAQVSAYRLASP